MTYRLIEGDFEAFFAAPFNAYGHSSHYVSPLKSDLRRFLDARRNPLFNRHGERSFFSVLRNGRPVGRIVAHIHRSSNIRHAVNRGCFGFFDCADDPVAAGMLLKAAEDWGVAHGCDEMAGNFNLTAMQQIGVVTAGYENEPYLDQIYNPPHIPSLLEQNGYRPFFPMTTFEVVLGQGSDKTLIVADPCGGVAGLRRERLRLLGFRRLMEATREVLNDGFEHNPMFVPLTREEFDFQAGELMWVIDQRIAPIDFDRQTPVGVVVCVPDVNPLLKDCGSRVGLSFPFLYARHWLNRRRAVIVFYAVRQAYQGRGVMGAMLRDVVQSLGTAGYTHLGVTWISDENTASLRQMEKLGARPLHRTHLFRKSLAP